MRLGLQPTRSDPLSSGNESVHQEFQLGKRMSNPVLQKPTLASFETNLAKLLAKRKIGEKEMEVEEEKA